MRLRYFDNSATTPLCKNAADEMHLCIEQRFGNPSSLHRLGIEAQIEVEKTRSALAGLLSCDARELYFTSGGTEANNTAVFGAANAKKRRGNRIVTTSIEHASVLEPMRELEKQGFEVVYLNPDSNGSISEEAVAAAVNKETILVSMMLVNNETGAIQPVQTAAKAVKAVGADALVHCDAVQAFGKIAVRPDALGADLISVSAHKIHGPKGIGALYVRKSAHITSRVFGGAQERGIRPGTESTILIAGFFGALKELSDAPKKLEYITSLRDKCAQWLGSIDGVEINSSLRGLPYILNISIAGIRSEVMLHFLEERNIFVSSGSACSRGQASHVLKAQGLPASRIDSAIRISFSTENTEEDVEALCEGVEDGIRRLRRTRN